MSRVTVGKWGNNLAIRVPFEIASATGLTDGEQVEIEAKGDDLVIHRPLVRERAAALSAVEAILKNARGRTLGGLSIKALIDEGRR